MGIGRRDQPLQGPLLPSQGRMTGDTAVAVKKIVMPSSPDIRKSTDMPLPRKNARKRNKGNRMP